LRVAFLAEVVLAIVSNSSSGCRLLQSQISAPAALWSMILLGKPEATFPDHA
jgi:hypothetical protein